MDLGGWLRRLGLEQYEAAFRENAIDDTVLPNLTAEDLKDLGVGFVGHRRKLLDAIAALRAIAKTLPSDAVPTVDTSSKDTAERRQVTVMFSDVVGSTALSARMDPEDLREVISTYQKCVAETVRRFGGFVAKYMGDGVLIYFGYPEAHEDDAERAVRAGLELIAAVTVLKSPVALQTRIGIATGLVVVGDSVGSGEAQERGIVGETPNLAARLQGIAEPNMVVIAEGTRRLLGNLFELQDRGPRDVKGIAGPTRAWAALRVSSVESRFEAMHATGLTSLVGREEEAELLVRRWSRAKTGEGQVVLVAGEAGIGKSRLTAAFSERIATEPHTRLRYFCSPQHTDSALYPFIVQLERAADFARNDTAEGKLAKLEALLAPGALGGEEVALIAELLSLPNSAANFNLSPQRKRKMLFEALRRQLEAVARKQPVLIMFEDAHWIDPTSLELLSTLVECIIPLPVLAIITLRSEFQAPWVGQQHVALMALNRLSPRDSIALVNQVVGLERRLPPHLRDQILDRTDGVPLFLEEVTKAVIEFGADGRVEGGGVSSASASRVMVPTTLHASLMARLDRLGTTAKEVAQIAAVIGREFEYDLLVAVAKRGDNEVRDALSRLVNSAVIFQRGVPPEATYIFKHALVRDTAYDSLLRAHRPELHARIADRLENGPPEVAARHYLEGGQAAKALVFWQRAAQIAMARSAYLEAIAQLDNCLEALRHLQNGPSTQAKELDLLVSRATALVALKGYGGTEIVEVYGRAEEICRRMGDPPNVCPVLFGLARARYNRAEFDEALRISRRLLDIAEIDRSPSLIIAANVLPGVIHYQRGAFAESITWFAKVESQYDERLHGALVANFVTDIGIVARMFRAHSLWCLGRQEEAYALSKAAVEAAERLGHPLTMAFAYCFGSMVHQFMGTIGLIDTWTANGLSVSDAHGFRQSIVFYSTRRHDNFQLMRDLLLLAIHLLVTLAKFLGPGGTRQVAAESLLLKHQLLISNRSRQRAPNLTMLDRLVLGLTTLFVSPHRIPKLSAILKPATLFKFHKALIHRKYRLLFSPSRRKRKPGPKGPSTQLIAAIVEMKRRNPKFGCVRIAQQINYAFGIKIDKDVVRRVLATHCRPEPGADGPSWLTLIAHAKDSVWSVDLFRVESILLRSHWVMLVMDVFTRRIIGFGIAPTSIDGMSVCRMFNCATAGQPKPKYLSTDHDPLFRFHRWLANLRVLEIEEIKSVPSAPVSHPFVERLIGTIRREYFDRVFFWNAADLARKLHDYKMYYNSHRVHRSLGGSTPALRAGVSSAVPASLDRHAWRPHCRGLFQTPIAA